MSIHSPAQPTTPEQPQDEDTATKEAAPDQATTPHSRIHWMLPVLMAQRNHMNQAELVQALEKDGAHVISRTQVWRMVNKSPAKISLDLIGALCRILQCTPNDLFGWEASPPSRDLNPTLTQIAEHGQQYIGAEAVPPLPDLPQGTRRLDEGERARVVGPPAQAFRAHPLSEKSK